MGQTESLTNKRTSVKKYQDALHEWEREYITSALKQCGNNLSEVARRTGLNRTHLYRVLKRIGERRARYGGNESWRQLSN